MMQLQARWIEWAERHHTVAWALRTAAVINVTCFFFTAAAPSASAQVGTAVAGSAGLTDSYGVPLTAYYLSLVSVPDQLVHTLGEIGLNPAGWVPKLVEGLTHTLGYWSLTGLLLSFEISAVVLLLTLVLWVLKIALSTLWLQWLANLGAPAVAVMSNIMHELYLPQFCFFLGLLCGAVVWVKGRPAQGVAIMAMAGLFALLMWTVFADPMTELYAPDGWLAQTRTLGYSVADQIVHNGRVGSGSTQDNLNRFVQSLVDNVGRRPVQVINFGHVIDNNPACAAAWSQAIMNGQSDGPVKAMQQCGDNAAWNYAANLDGANVMLAFLVIVSTMIFGYFITTIALLAILTGAKAWWWALIITPLLAFGMIPGKPRQRALNGIAEIFTHGITFLVLVVYLGVSAQVVGALLSDPAIAQQIGADVPLVRLLMMVIGSIVAVLLMHWIKKWLHLPATHSMWHAMRHPVSSTKEAAGRHLSDFKPYSDGARRWAAERGERATESGKGLDAMFQRAPVHKGSVGATAEKSMSPGVKAAATDGAKRAAIADGAAGTAAEVAAPEVAIPAMAAKKVVDGHKRRRQQPTAQQADQRQETSPGATQVLDRSDEQPRQADQGRARTPAPAPSSTPSPSPSVTSSSDRTPSSNRGRGAHAAPSGDRPSPGLQRLYGGVAQSPPSRDQARERGGNGDDQQPPRRSHGDSERFGRRP